MLKRGLILGGAFVLFSGVFVSSAFADNNVDFSITIRDAALQLTVPPTANLDLTPTSTNADFKSTNLTVSVGTNNATGYTLTMSVPSTDISRIGAASGDPVIGTLGNQTGGYSQNDFTVNKWGYKITGNNYFPITTTLSPSQWITDGPANSVDNTITLASKVSTDIPAGTYKTTLTFSAVANQIDTSSFRIIYNSNGGTGTMSPTIIGYGTTTSLTTNTFTKTGYTFIGWYENANGMGNVYQDGSNYTAPADDAGSSYVVLYAAWKKDGDPTPTDPCSSNLDCDSTSGTTLQRAYEIAYTAAHKGMYEETTAGSNTYTYIDSWNGGHYQGEGRDVRFLIQDMTPEICASATVINSQALVLDIRDQSSYYIVKATDGRCWMQDNLSLDLVNTSIDALKGNTNATDVALEYLKGIRIGTSSDRYANAGVAEWGSSSTYTEKPLIETRYKNYTRSSLTNPDDTMTEANNWRFGIYYNYCAVSAGTYCGAGYNKPDTFIDTEEDVCPANWRLPTDATSNVFAELGDFEKLTHSIKGSTGSISDNDQYVSFRKMMRLPIPGRYYGSLNIPGYYAYYWSSTYRSDGSMYCLGMGTGGIYPHDCEDRVYGYTVRCLAKQRSE